MIRKEAIQDLLMRMGITPNYDGFTYIVEGVLYIDAHGTYHIGDLYEEVARKCNTRYGCVERSIRYALYRMRQRTPDRDLVQTYFGLGHASNSRSLSRFHLMLARDQEGGEAG